MGRVKVSYVFGTVLLLVVVLGVASKASAQVTTTINQTSCIPGTGSCLTDNLLQDLTVNCSVSGAAGRISTALSSIADRSGPNRITVSGTCSSEPVTISGFNRLTLRGTPGVGATIARGLTLQNSRAIFLQGLTFDFATALGQSIVMNGATANLDGVTVKNTGSHGISLFGSSISFGSTAPSVITSNGLNGIDVGAGSQVTVVNVTISNNGQQFAGEQQSSGIGVHNGGTVILANQLFPAGVATDYASNISGNTGSGIGVFGGTLTTSAGNGAAYVRIHNNGAEGVASGAGTVWLSGKVQIDSNEGDDGMATQLALYGSTGAVGNGAIITGSPAILGAANSTVILGDGDGAVITGGVQLYVGSVAPIFDSISLDSLACDASSFSPNFAGVVVAANTCPNDGPTGSQGPAGPQGPQGPAGPLHPGMTASGGNIGIGTTPIAKLDIAAGVNDGIRLSDGSVTGILYASGLLGKSFAFGTQTNHPFIFGTNNTFNRLAIAANGNVGVGTTAPLAKLDVSPGVNDGLRVSDGTLTGILFTSGFLGRSFAFGTQTNHAFIFGTNDTWGRLTIAADGKIGIGTMTPTQPLEMASGAYVSAGGVWTNASSRALKQDITDLSSAQAVQAFEHLTPVTFAYKADPAQTHVGFIAEDVPDLVATLDRKSLSAMDLVALLTKVVQTKSDELAQQQRTIDQLLARVAALEKHGDER